MFSLNTFFTTDIFENSDWDGKRRIRAEVDGKSGFNDTIPLGYLSYRAEAYRVSQRLELFLRTHCYCRFVKNFRSQAADMECNVH